jgi:glycosyltransferase involved in cell wall biosynthesis
MEYHMTGAPPGLSFVIPVYNEGENIARQLDALRAATDLGSHEIIIVYDHDSDNTLPALERLAPSFPNLRVIKNAYGEGARCAIRTGLEAARGEGTCVMMADLSDDLDLLPRMEKLLGEGFDLVAPSRYMAGGRQIGGPWLKRMLSGLTGRSLYLLAGLPTHDPTNNFKLYRASMLREIDIVPDGGFDLALEITVKAWRAGYRIAEIPAIWWDRSEGQSRFRLWKWLPNYLKWYGLAFLPRRRVKPSA